MVTYPYEGNIDVDDKQGLMLFNKATEALSLEKKLALTQQNGPVIHQMVKDKSRLYHWGIVLSKIPQDTTDPSSFKSLVIQPMLVSLESGMKAASTCWSKEDYSNDKDKLLPVQNIVATLDPNNPDDVVLHYERTRRIMIAKALLGMFKSGALNTIMLKKKLFQYKTSADKIYEDGPTILKLIFQEASPATRTSLIHWKEIISGAKLGAYQNNVHTMLNAMQKAYEEIINNDEQHSDYMIHLFAALLSSSHEVFNHYTQNFKNKWEANDSMITHEYLIDKSKQKYTNLVKEGSWIKTKEKKHQQIALTTQKNGRKQEDNNKKDSKCKIPAIKKKFDGNKKMIGGVQHWWCPHHKWEGEFDGLYMTHTPDKGHDEWKKAKDARKQKYKEQKGSKSSSSNNSTKSKKKLSCTSEMRAALCTSLQIEPEEFDEKISASEDFQ